MRETPAWFGYALSVFIAFIMFFATTARAGFPLGLLAFVGCVLLGAGFVYARRRVIDKGLRMALRILFIYGFLALCTWVLQAPRFFYATWAIFALLLGSLELLQRPRE